MCVLPTQVRPALRWLLEQEFENSCEFNGHFPAVSLFVDTVGFTAITAALMQHGKEGSEALADVMNALFEPLVRSVYEQGGFITNFSGDAFTALFPGQEALTYQRALAAAWGIRQHLVANPRYATPYGFITFKVKVSLADGNVEWGILPQVRPTCYFCGEAIDCCIQGEQYADGGGVVLSRAVYTVLRDFVRAEAVAGRFRVTAVHGDLPAPDPQIAAAFSAPETRQLVAQGEFRQVLTLFLNLQTSDAPDQLTARAPAEFMRPCLRLLQEYGGHLGRIGQIGTRDRGHTLLLFWGAPTGYEDNVERALNFVLDLRRAATTPFRAGITYHVAYAGFIGSALRKEYTCYGLGVSQAARQMVMADWGDIWLDEATAQRAGACFQVEPLGYFALKGFAEKKAVYALRGRREALGTALYQRRLAVCQRELIEQLLHCLGEGGGLVEGENGLTPAGVNGRIPVDMRAVLIACLDRLPPEVREVVKVAAVLGREFEIPVLAQMLPHDADVESKVEAATRAAIWSPLTKARYAFRHALMRDVAYDMQLRARLRGLHQRAVEALECLHAKDLALYADEVAYHSKAALRYGWRDPREKAWTYLEKAPGPINLLALS